MIAERNPWVILAIVSAGLFLVGIDMTVLNVALPILAYELGATTSEKLWMVNAYSLVLAGLLPGFGTLSDRVGHRRMFIAGLTVFGLSSALAAFSPTPAVLIGARGLLAVGAAMMMPATISIIRIVFTRDQERAVAIGIWGSISAGATALGPILGGFLLEHFCWGAVFLINVPVVLATMLFAFAKIPPMSGNPSRHWDAATSAILTVALVALLYALKGLLKVDIHWTEVTASALVGGAFFVWFLRRQRFLASPLIDFALFADPRFSMGAVGALFASFVMVGLQYALSQETQLVRGFTPLHAGLYILPIAVGSFLAGPALGAILFRFGVERMMAFSLGFAALAMVLFTATGETASLPWQISLLTLLGFGLGGMMAVGSTSIMISAAEEKAGMAGALEGIAYELGGTLGVAIMGSIIASVYALSFAPPADAILPPSAWDSLDQTLIAADRLAASALPVIAAGKTAFMNGVSNALLTGTVLTTALFLLAVLFAWNKKPDKGAAAHR